MYYDAMGAGYFAIGVMIILIGIVVAVLIASSILLGILLVKKKKENEADRRAGTSGPEEPEA